MDKRTFLKTLGLGTAAVASGMGGTLLTGCCASGRKEESDTTSANDGFVKNWVWMRIDQSISDTDYINRFKALRANGISGVMFEQDSERHFTMAKECGLEAHRWKWTMNRGDEYIMKNHPEWYAKNRKGESSWDKPAYVQYYRFACPNNEDFVKYLIEDYAKEAEKQYIDGIHLDYVRYPDVILPVGLWKNYGIQQTQELPEYDYCYCETCRKKFKDLKGVDPMDLQFPMESQSWINFRLDAITNVVDQITERIHGMGKPISAAVFPGPSMAKRMVRQDWGNWNLDAYFPMIYNGFYNEDVDWIGTSTRESVKTLNGRGKVYSGVFFPDIKAKFAEACGHAFNAGASGIAFFDGPDDKHLGLFSEFLAKNDLKVK